MIGPAISTVLTVGSAAMARGSSGRTRASTNQRMRCLGIVKYSRVWECIAAALLDTPGCSARLL